MTKRIMELIHQKQAVTSELGCVRHLYVLKGALNYGIHILPILVGGGFLIILVTIHPSRKHQRRRGKLLFYNPCKRRTFYPAASGELI